MKLFKIKIKFVPVYIYPFGFLDDWKRSILLQFKYLKIKKHLKKLNWDSHKVWELTSFCDSQNDAVNKLCYELTDDRTVFPKLRKLLHLRFEKDWK